MASGAAVDRHESDRQRHRAVFKFLDTTKDRGAEEESRSISATTVEYGHNGEAEDYDDEYYDDEYEDGMSGDYEIEFPHGNADKFRIFLRLLSLVCHFFPKDRQLNVIFLLCFWFSCHVQQTQRPICHPRR